MMLKKLIPAAAVLALAGAAQAQVSVYGLLDLSYGKSLADDATNKKANIHSGADNGGSQGNSVSRVGIKGTTDLAPGIKGNFKLETGGIDLDGKVNGGDGPFFYRQAWAGVTGGFGEVRVGRDDDVIFQTFIGFDMNGAANMASAGGNTGLGILGNGRVSRQVQYISPAFGGFSAHVAHAPQDSEIVGAKAFSSFALKYTAGALSLALANEGKRTSTDEANMLYAGSYDFGVAKLAVMNSQTKGAKGTQYGISAPVAGLTVGMQYAKNSSNKDKGTEFFVNKEIFKNTVAYMDIGSKKAANGTKTNGYAVGAIYVF